ncbi:MAG: hypothetical protein LUC27_06550, partial [Lachnospiraceae bacterium]|nr:hypothetical protein [Lachnospiraceae bacterium]
VSIAKRFVVDEYAIKYMIVIYINYLTERVYTERNVQWLKEEIEKIKQTGRFVSLVYFVCILNVGVTRELPPRATPLHIEKQRFS